MKWRKDKDHDFVADETNGTVVGNVTLQTQVPNGRSITFQVALLDSDFYGGVKAINERIDVLQNIAKRQQILCGIEIRESTLEGQVRNLELIRKTFEDMTDQVNKGRKLTSQQQQQFVNRQATIDAAIAQIKEQEEGIELAKRQAKELEESG